MESMQGRRYHPFLIEARDMGPRTSRRIVGNGFGYKTLLLSIMMAVPAPSLRAQERGPSLEDTIQFMAGSIKAGGALTTRDRKLRFTELFVNRGCAVTVTDRDQDLNSAGVLGEPWDVTDTYSLADIDPTSIRVLDYSDMFPRSTSIELDTTNYRDAVFSTSGSAIKMNVANPGFIISSDYLPDSLKL